MRLALGISYRGCAYSGWQSQPDRPTVQDCLERALSRFAEEEIRTICAGRTDAGVHGLNQVVHLDSTRKRREFSWVRGTNRYLPADVSVHWCKEVAPEFHARNLARFRRYAYVLKQSPVRPSWEQGQVGWLFAPLDAQAMRLAAQSLLGEHDFSAFRAAQCQALSPVKHLQLVNIRHQASLWRFDFQANAFLHHMIRNIMGCLLAVGTGSRPVSWMREVLLSRNREMAAPTFSAEGLYFLGPQYDDQWGLPNRSDALDALPLEL
jgi:tRNA pseudouridine38-40 synthase